MLGVVCIVMSLVGCRDTITAVTGLTKYEKGFAINGVTLLKAAPMLAPGGSLFF